MQLFIANKNYSSWSLRPWVLCKELNIAFEEFLMPFGDSSDGPCFTSETPSGLVPFLKDGDFEVWDSLAIVEYLAELHPAVWPTEKRARVWARCAASEMHSGFFALRKYCPMNCSIEVEIESMPEALARDIKRLEALWSEGFERFGGPFLAGSAFSAVDAFFVPVAFRVKSFGLTLSPTSMEYVTRLLGLQSVVEWNESARAEPWIDEAHEQDCTLIGRITRDFRIAQ